MKGHSTNTNIALNPQQKSKDVIVREDEERENINGLNNVILS